MPQESCGTSSAPTGVCATKVCGVLNPLGEANMWVLAGTHLAAPLLDTAAPPTPCRPRCRRSPPLFLALQSQAHSECTAIKILRLGFVVPGMLMQCGRLSHHTLCSYQVQR